MPTSIPLMDDDVREALRAIKPGMATALDVGAGCGKSGALIKEIAPDCAVLGLEPHAPYHQQYAAEHKRLYTMVMPQTFDEYIRTHPDNRFDLIMFGDVLEHMRWADMVSALHDAAYHSRHFIGVFPEMLVQGAVQDNPYEMHRCRVDLDVADRFRMVCHRERLTNEGYRKHFVWWRGYLP